MTGIAMQDETEADVAEEATDGQVVDPTVLQSLISQLGERGPAMLARLLDTWEGEIAKRLRELRVAVDAADADGVSRVAHAVRGSSASMGAHLLAQVCGDVETRVRQGETVDLPESQQRMTEAVEQTRTALGQLRVGSAG